MVFIYCLLSFFSDAAYSEHSYLVEIVVERSIFQCNKRSKKCSKIITIKKNMLSSGIEIYI